MTFNDLFKDAIVVHKNTDEVEKESKDSEPESCEDKSDEFEDVLACNGQDKVSDILDAELLELEAWKKYLPSIPQVEDLDHFFDSMMKKDRNSVAEQIIKMEREKESNPEIVDKLFLYVEFLQQLLKYKSTSSTDMNQLEETTPIRSKPSIHSTDNKHKRKKPITPETTEKGTSSSGVNLIHTINEKVERKHIITPPRSAIKEEEPKIISKDQFREKTPKLSYKILSEKTPTIVKDIEPLIQKSKQIEEHTSKVLKSKVSNDERGYVPKIKLNDKNTVPNPKATAYYKTLKKQFEEDENALTTEHSKLTAVGNEVTGDMIYDCKRLLRLFGIPFVDSPSEAEAQCAHLSSLGIVDGIASDDSDIMLFLKDNDKKATVFRYLFKANKSIQLYKKDDLLKDAYSQQALIFIAYLVGCDYCDGVKGIGPKTASQLKGEFMKTSSNNSTKAIEELKECASALRSNTDNGPKNISKINTKLKNMDFEENFPNPKVARCFEDPTVDDNCQTFEFIEPEFDEITKFMEENLGWTKRKTKESLDPVMKNRAKYISNAKNSKTISNYFVDLKKK